MKEVEEKIRDELKPWFKGKVKLEVPDSPEHGDYATNACLREAERKDPRELAEKVLEKIDPQKLKFLDKVEVAGPGFINFFLDKGEYTKEVLNRIESEEKDYGSQDLGGGRKILIDYSAPNIGKPMHVGHLRSTIIGNSLYRILEFVGFDCTGINYLGDLGTQFGKLIYAFKNWGNEEKLKNNPIHHLLDLYVKFHEEAEDNETLEEEARKWGKRLEDGDQEAEKLWREFTRQSKQRLREIYGRLNVVFDSWKGESFFKDRAKEVVEDALESGVAEREEDGSVLIKTGIENYPPYLIQRSDGGTLYSTRDLAAIKYRKQEYDFDRALYVVGAPQEMHFRQLFESAERLGYAEKDELAHVKFGLMRLPGGGMSTREGRVIFLDDVLDKARDKALKAVEEKNPDLQEKERVSEKVGIGAIKYFDLSKNRRTNVKFSWDEALDFEGSSGPYLQYSYARACGILDKVEPSGKGEIQDIQEIEFRLIKELGRFHKPVIEAARNYEPHRIANYLNDLCETFNEFYHECRVKGSEREGLRREMVEAFKIVLGTGLDLLNVPKLKEM